MCLSCAPGFVVSSSQCLQCVANCQECASTTACSTCKMGYYLNSNKQCSPCSSNCMECSASGASCVQCDTGYSIVSGLCVDCDSLISNCDTCNILANSFVCTSCQPGYYSKSSTLCAPCPPNCL